MKDKIKNYNIYKSKKWASLVITLTYWILLLTAATNLIYLILSTQLWTWTWERYNMAYFAAEWWIDQAIYESNVHWVWFSWAISLSDLNQRIEYQWDAIWRKAWNQTWYLVIWDHPNKVDYLDKELGKYLSSRRLHFYYDNWGPWDPIDKINTCLNETVQVDISVMWVIWNNINSSDTNRIIYWKLDMKDTDSQWSWFVLQPSGSCNNDADDTDDPFCYLTTWNFSQNNWQLNFSTSRWNCKDDISNNCSTSRMPISNFWWAISPLVDPLNIYNPDFLLSYVSPLYNTVTPDIFYPIYYSIDWNNIDNCQFPTTTIKLRSTGLVRWAKIELSAQMSQEEGITVFDYAVIQ